MKRGVCFVSVCCLVLALGTTALAQVAYPPLLAAEAALCPGCTMTMAAKDGKNVQAMLQSAEPADKILTYYRETLTAKGWDVALEMDMAQAKTMSFARGESTLAVAIVPQDDGKSVVTLGLETP